MIKNNIKTIDFDEYQLRELQNAITLAEEVNALDYNVEILQGDNSQSDFNVIIEGKYQIRKASYTGHVRVSEYPYSYNSELSSYTKAELYRKYKLDNMKVLTKKKLQQRLDNVDMEQAELKAESIKVIDKKAEFLESVKHLPIVYSYKDYDKKDEITGGSLVKNGIEFEFSFSQDGYISKKVTIHYTVNHNLDDFLKLSDNKYNN